MALKGPHEKVNKRTLVQCVQRAKQLRRQTALKINWNTAVGPTEHSPRLTIACLLDFGSVKQLPMPHLLERGMETCVWAVSTDGRAPGSLGWLDTLW